MHPGKDLALLLLTSDKKVVFMSYGGTAGSANGEYSWTTQEFLRLHFHSDGLADRAQVTYMQRIGDEDSAVLRVEGYDQNGDKMLVDDDRYRHKDWDIVGIQVIL